MIKQMFNNKIESLKTDDCPSCPNSLTPVNTSLKLSTKLIDERRSNDVKLSSIKLRVSSEVKSRSLIRSEKKKKIVLLSGQKLINKYFKKQTDDDTKKKNFEVIDKYDPNNSDYVEDKIDQDKENKIHSAMNLDKENKEDPKCQYKCQDEDQAELVIVKKEDDKKIVTEEIEKEEIVSEAIQKSLQPYRNNIDLNISTRVSSLVGEKTLVKQFPRGLTNASKKYLHK